MQVELIAGGEFLISRNDGLVMLASMRGLRSEQCRDKAYSELRKCATLAEAKLTMTSLGIGWTELYGRLPKRCQAKGDTSKLINKLVRGATL